MTTRTNARGDLAPPRPPEAAPGSSWEAAPTTTAERLERIQTLAQRIAQHVQFMSKASKLGGVSAETKERAVMAFYERMILVERQLGRIQEDLQLG